MTTTEPTIESLQAELEAARAAVLAAGKKGDFEALKSNMVNVTKLESQIDRINKAAEKARIEAEQNRNLEMANSIKMAVEAAIAGETAQSIIDLGKTVMLKVVDGAITIDVLVPTVKVAKSTTSTNGTGQKPRVVWLHNGNEYKTRDLATYLIDNVANYPANVQEVINVMAKNIEDNQPYGNQITKLESLQVMSRK